MSPRSIFSQKSYLKFFWLFLLVFASCQDQVEVPVSKGDDGQIFAIDTKDSDIPYFVLDTKGSEIQYNSEVSAKMKIYQTKKLIQEQAITIEYRGKTSFRLSDKKGFNVETVDASGEGEDVSILGFPEEEDWRLIGHLVNVDDKYIWDQSLIFNAFAYEISRKMGKYSSRGKFVELEVNGEYLGLYYFCEKLKRDSNRINIKSLNATSTNLTGGYILKIDKADSGPENDGKPLSYFQNNWDDDARFTAFNSFRSSYDIFGKPLTFEPYRPPYHSQQYLEIYFNYEYPKAEELTANQKAYIADYINKFEKALLNDDFASPTRTYTQFMDVNSFVDFFLINELCRNQDAYRISTFLQKDRDGKLAMGPVWDFNLGFNEGGRIPMNDWVINFNKYVKSGDFMVPFWWNRLLADPQFKKAVKDRWFQLRQAELTTGELNNLVDELVNPLQKNGAVLRNYAKWDQGIGVNYDQSIQNLKVFLNQRSSWMDSQISKW